MVFRETIFEIKQCIIWFYRFLFTVFVTLAILLNIDQFMQRYLEIIAAAYILFYIGTMLSLCILFIHKLFKVHSNIMADDVVLSYAKFRNYYFKLCGSIHIKCGECTKKLMNNSIQNAKRVQTVIEEDVKPVVIDAIQTQEVKIDETRNLFSLSSQLIQDQHSLLVNT